MAQAVLEAKVARIAAYLDACRDFGFCGTVLIASGDRVEFCAGRGPAQRAGETTAERANGPDTRFEIASATKPFTAVAILQLAAQGKLRLEDPIEKYLPGVPAERRGITVDHLLTHTSGMPRAAAGGRGDDLAVAVAGYFATPARRAPGADHEYWNGGYALLAGIVERVSGTSYMDWCRINIFAKAGMHDTGFTGDDLGNDIAIGYEGTPPPRAATEHPYGSYGWHYRGMGGIVTTAPDLHRFARALLAGQLLDAATRTTLWTERAGNYARGFYCVDRPRRKVSHGGDVRGFHTQFAIYPDDAVCIVVLCNVGDVPTWTIAENLQHLWFGDPSRAPLPPQADALTVAELGTLAGTYQRARATDEALTVVVAGRGVRIAASGLQTTARLARSLFGPVQSADAKDVASARAILEALAKGDVAPLRRSLAAGIPESWPEMVSERLWPKAVAPHGAVRTIRSIGATLEDRTTTLLFALEQETGRSMVRMEMVGGRVRLLDLRGPNSLAEVLAVPVRGQLQQFAWQGKPPEPFTVRRATDGTVRALVYKTDEFLRR
jgi:CubicO group peptidase (beta-lactamase class C family)